MILRNEADNGFTYIAAHAFAFGGFDPGSFPTPTLIGAPAFPPDPDRSVSYMSSELLTWWTPFIPRDQPGWAWRTKGARQRRRRKSRLVAAPDNELGADGGFGSRP